MLSCMLIFSFGVPEFTAQAKTTTQLKQEKEKLEKEKNEAQKALEEAKNKQKSVAQEVEILDKSMQQAEDELNKVETQLKETTQRLEQSQKELEAATKAKQIQLNTFKKRVKYIHENGSIGYLKVVLDSQNFNDLLTRMQYVNDIMSYDNETLEELKKNEAIIDTKTKEIAEDKIKVETLAKEQKEKTTALQAKLDEKTQLMQSYEKDAEKYAQIVEENEKASKEVENLIRQAEQAAAAQAAQAAQARAKKSSSNANSSTGSNDNSSDSEEETFVYTGGQLNWPVPARSPSSSSLSSGYVGRKRPIGSGSEFHTGYDIPAPYGSNIVAAESGTVITAGWVNGYGNTVIISHGGGLSTLYGHNSRLVVSVGDSVSRGQTIAKCGSTGNSTGNHCHFEVRVNGSHTSPEPYLGVPNISR